MAIAGIAHYFYPCHTIGFIHVVFNSIFFDRLGKAWPSGARIKFDGRIEQRRAATNAGVCSGIIPVTQLTTEAWLCTFFACYAELPGCQYRFPFRFCFVHSLVRKNWSNKADAVSAAEVIKVKQKFNGRQKPFTMEELNAW